MSTQGTGTARVQTSERAITYEQLFEATRVVGIIHLPFKEIDMRPRTLAALAFAEELLPEPGPTFTVRERAGMLLLPHRRGAYSERARTFAKALHYGTHEGDVATQVLAALMAAGAEWDDGAGRWVLP